MRCILANINIVVVEGGTFDKTYQWKTGTPAVAVDLTGFTALMQIRKKVKSEDVLLEIPFKDTTWIADGETGIYLYDGNYVPEDLGKYRIYIKDNDTDGLCADHKDIIGAYDLFLYNAEGESVLKQYGTATIYASVTRNE
jgi:hypothetical protein